MSFNFQWADAFSPSFCDSAKNILETALNKGNTPALIDGRIEVRELDMGKIPPTLSLLEIGDLQADRFKGIFRLGYDGDARLVLGARVQANPLNPSSSPLPTSTAPLAAHRPLLVPMALTLSNLRLRAIVVLIVSKNNGITIVFKNDPLESLDVSSTFDSISVLKGFIQKEIEGQLREMFREDLPGIIHTLSQTWFKTSVEVERPPPPPPPPASSAMPSPYMSSSSSGSTSYASDSPPPTPDSQSLPETVAQGLPETISHLSQLSLSNHTLSRYTREHAHVAMRSCPPSAFRANSAYGGGGGSVNGGLATPGGAGARKAVRKRMHRFNSTGDAASAPASSATSGRSTAAFPSAPSSARSSPPPNSRRSSVFPAPPPPPVFAAGATPLRPPKLESRASYGFPTVFEDASSFAPISRRRVDRIY